MLLLPHPSYRYTTWQFKCVSGYGLSCSLAGNDTNFTQVVSSPSAITPTAASSSVNLSITNSSVTPAKQNSSSSENGAQAREYAPRFQNFVITSSVVFIKVPAVKPQRVKRWVGLMLMVKTLPALSGMKRLQGTRGICTLHGPTLVVLK